MKTIRDAIKHLDIKYTETVGNYYKKPLTIDNLKECSIKLETFLELKKELHKLEGGAKMKTIKDAIIHLENKYEETVEHHHNQPLTVNNIVERTIKLNTILEIIKELYEIEGGETVDYNITQRTQPPTP